MPVSEFSGPRFPFRTPGGPFSSLTVGKASISSPNSLTGSPICEPSVPTRFSTLEHSVCAGFGFFQSPHIYPLPSSSPSSQFIPLVLDFFFLQLQEARPFFQTLFLLQLSSKRNPAFQFSFINFAFFFFGLGG